MKKFALGPMLWSSIAFIFGAAIASYTALRQLNYMQANPQSGVTDIPDIPYIPGGIPVIPLDYAPDIPSQSPMIYFFCAAVVIGLVLFLIPISKLKWIFRILFLLLFTWGVFVILGLNLTSLPLVSIIAIVAGLVWFFRSSVWLHNLLMLMALIGIGSVFGILLDPWPIMIFLFMLAVYDYFAVRFGYMMWMAKKLSQSDSLPAFIIPKTKSNWNQNLRTTGSQNIIEGEESEREYSILGGGDIGFPLILMVSVLSTYGFVSSMIVAGFSLIGLISAFVIQGLFLKGKPMPALPTIALASFIGLLIVHFVII